MLGAILATQRITHLVAGMPQFTLDSEFQWSRDNYSSTQRSIDIWTFIVSLRTKLYLLDQKWTYVGGWTEEKKTERLRSTASWTRSPQLLQLAMALPSMHWLASKCISAQHPPEGAFMFEC